MDLRHQSMAKLLAIKAQPEMSSLRLLYRWDVVFDFKGLQTHLNTPCLSFIVDYPWILDYLEFIFSVWLGLKLEG